MKAAKMLALASVVGLAVAACWAKDPSTTRPAKNCLRGKIVKVEDGSVVVQTKVAKKEYKEVTVATDDKTVVTVDKKEATVADLKEGLQVMVTPAEGTATKITAWSIKRKPSTQTKPAECE